MRRLWAEFKAITIGGTVLDLALGFIIGTAFATLIQSFVTNLFLQVVAAFVGEPDFQKLVVTVNGTPIKYGVFANDLLQFVLLAVGLFLLIKLMVWIGVERGRSLDQRPCPFCYDRVPAAALICRSCGQELVEELPSLAEAQQIYATRAARHWVSIPKRRDRGDRGDRGDSGTVTASRPDGPAVPNEPSETPQEPERERRQRDA